MIYKHKLGSEPPKLKEERVSNMRRWTLRLKSVYHPLVVVRSTVVHVEDIMPVPGGGCHPVGHLSTDPTRNRALTECRGGKIERSTHKVEHNQYKSSEQNNGDTLNSCSRGSAY